MLFSIKISIILLGRNVRAKEIRWLSRNYLFQKKCKKYKYLSITDF